MAREFAHPASVAPARRAVVEVCRMMHQRGYLVARDGNVSVRIGEGRLLVTPSGARKGFLDPADLVLCDLAGQPLRGERARPSAEIMMHVAIYEERPDVSAVVHAHPPCAVAHTIAGVGLSTPLLPETYCELGEIVTVPYTTPTTEEVPAALRGVVRDRCALVMERHGSITLGETLSQAYDRLEILEHTAKISLMSNVLAPGRVSGLNDAQRGKLQALLGCGLGC